MAFYFHGNAKRARGRPITTLPMTLNNDPKILQNRSISLTSQKDLETLRKIAERRQEWITFTADIKKAAELGGLTTLLAEGLKSVSQCVRNT